MQATAQMIPDTWPDVMRLDVETILVSEWLVGTLERQHAAANASMAAWDRYPWPRGLLSHNCFGAAGGKTVLHYSQWTGGETVAEFQQSDQSKEAAARSRNREILGTVPGVERLGVGSYRLRSSTVWDSSAPVPGCLVVIRFQVDGPEQQRQLYDSLSSADPAADPPHPGLISSHFHASVDGSQVLNYAEWRDEAAHQELMASPAISGRNRILDGMRGVRPLGFKRYRFLRSLAVPMNL